MKFDNLWLVITGLILSPLLLLVTLSGEAQTISNGVLVAATNNSNDVQVELYERVEGVFYFNVVIPAGIYILDATPFNLPTTGIEQFEVLDWSGNSGSIRVAGEGRVLDLEISTTGVRTLSEWDYSSILERLEPLLELENIVFTESCILALDSGISQSCTSDSFEVELLLPHPTDESYGTTTLLIMSDALDYPVPFVGNDELPFADAMFNLTGNPFPVTGVIAGTHSAFLGPQCVGDNFQREIRITEDHEGRFVFNMECYINWDQFETEYLQITVALDYMNINYAYSDRDIGYSDYMFGRDLYTSWLRPGEGYLLADTSVSEPVGIFYSGAENFQAFAVFISPEGLSEIWRYDSQTGTFDDAPVMQAVEGCHFTGAPQQGESYLDYGSFTYQQCFDTVNGVVTNDAPSFSAMTVPTF